LHCSDQQMSPACGVSSTSKQWIILPINWLKWFVCDWHTKWDDL